MKDQLHNVKYNEIAQLLVQWLQAHALDISLEVGKLW